MIKDKKNYLAEINLKKSRLNELSTYILNLAVGFKIFCFFFNPTIISKKNPTFMHVPCLATNFKIDFFYIKKKKLTENGYYAFLYWASQNQL